MSDLLLLAVFVTHLPFFIWRYRSTGERRYAATSVTFGLLVATYALRVFAPGFQLAGVALHSVLRPVALVSAVLSISLLARHLVVTRRRKAAASDRNPMRAELPGRRPE